MNNVADLLIDNRCWVGERPLCLSASPFLATRRMIAATERVRPGHLGQRWSVCLIAGETGGKVQVVKARWGESRRVGGQGGSRADVSRAEDGRAARKDAVPWMPLLQPGVGRGGEENRDKIKLQTRSARRHAAAA